MDAAGSSIGQVTIYQRCLRGFPQSEAQDLLLSCLGRVRNDPSLTAQNKAFVDAASLTSQVLLKVENAMKITRGIS
jgi:hypothetical protein